MNKLVKNFPKVGNKTVTENLAVTHKSTKNPVLDFFYHAPARQGQDNTDLFASAFESDANLALKTLFYLRDIRQGKGQRKTFRDCLRYLFFNDIKVFNQLVAWVPEFGRWDDILEFTDSRAVRQLVIGQFNVDLADPHPSLLGKWMPSENASSKQTKSLAEKWIDYLEMSPKTYRTHLTHLRTKLRIIENYMSHGAWELINYGQVPSRAMKLYRKAFGRHDAERFGEFIEQALATPAYAAAAPIHSDGIYPHEIVHEFINGNGDKALEAQWKRLPNFLGDEERNVLVVCDTSGSMFTSLAPGTSVQSIDVSVGLAIYCAERNKGAFQNIVVTFNDNPSFVTLKGDSLRSSVEQVKCLPWGGSTNVEGVFLSLLRIAKSNMVPQKDMPTNIVIISDMEFNNCGANTNLKNARKLFEAAGYEMPMLTFWNVNSRHNQTPATKHSGDAFLVSGFSAETIGKVLQAKAVNPEELMLETLNSERYSFIDSIEL